MNEITRYRVTGAVFLLAIAIIVLPMVFDGEGVRVKQLPELAVPLPPAPSDEELAALNIPSEAIELHREEMEVASGLIDKDGFDTADNTKLGDPALREVIELAEPETVVDAGVTRQSDDPAAAAGNAGKPTVSAPAVTEPNAGKLVRTAPPVRPPAGDSGASRSPTKTPAQPLNGPLAKRAIWAVQLASFASPVNATALRDRLLKDGFEAWTSTAKADSSVRTRVAIGPLLDRRDAERMRDLVSGRYKVSAIVVHMDP